MIDAKKATSGQLLFQSAQEMGLQPVWLAPYHLFVVTTSHGERYINSGLSSLNSQMSASLARNKYATRLILERHHLANIPYLRPQTMAQAQAFLATHGTIVVKPLRGQGARDVHIVSSFMELARLPIAGYILEKYILGKEVRYLILNSSVIGMHQSEYGTSVAEDRPLQRISYNADSWDPELVGLSVKINDIFNLAFSAVDYLIDTSGKPYVLEINSAPGFHWFHAPSKGPSVDLARLFLEAMISDTSPQQADVIPTPVTV